jgi:hypothetical protein
LEVSASPKAIRWNEGLDWYELAFLLFAVRFDKSSELIEG